MTLRELLDTLDGAGIIVTDYDEIENVLGNLNIWFYDVPMLDDEITAIKAEESKGD